MSEIKKGENEAANRLETYFLPLIRHLKTLTRVGEGTLIHVREEDLTEMELAAWDEFRSLDKKIINALEAIRDNQSAELNEADAALSALLTEVRQLADSFQQREQDQTNPAGRRKFYDWLLSPMSSLLTNLDYVEIQLARGKREQIQWEDIIGDLRKLFDRGQ